MDRIRWQLTVPFPYRLHRASLRHENSDQVIERTTPPSTRSAAPFVADESGLTMNATNEATSSGVANRLSRELGRIVSKNSFSTRSEERRVGKECRCGGSRRRQQRTDMPAI